MSWFHNLNDIKNHFARIYLHNTDTQMTFHLSWFAQMSAVCLSSNGLHAMESATNIVHNTLRYVYRFNDKVLQFLIQSFSNSMTNQSKTKNKKYFERMFPLINWENSIEYVFFLPKKLMKIEKNKMTALHFFYWKVEIIHCLRKNATKSYIHTKNIISNLERVFSSIVYMSQSLSPSEAASAQNTIKTQYLTIHFYVVLTF